MLIIHPRLLFFLCAATLYPALIAQPTPKPDDKVAEPVTTATAKEESAVTEHSIRIDGKTISYRAVAGTTFINDTKGESAALVYSTSYIRSDVKDLSLRPIAFLFNGGPGSSSIWLHLGAFGPRHVATSDADFTPPPPYQLLDNTNSLLDMADLVFVDPVGTGFSHAVGKAQNKDFYGVDPDIKSLGQFISTYLSRNNRWNSPKFLIGESYGTFRCAALADHLQSSYGIALNGVVLISSVLQFSPRGDLGYALLLPTFAATAWDHKAVDRKAPTLAAFLAEIEHFAQTEYASALIEGSSLPDNARQSLAAKLASYTGLGERYWLDANLRVNSGQFRAELERARGLNVGRYDTRFTGAMHNRLAEGADSDPSYDAIAGAFISAFNVYVRNELNFGMDKSYHTFVSGDDGGEWEFKHNGDPNPDATGDLVDAIVSNPHLKIEIESGYDDLATPFFATDYTVRHLGLPANLRGNIRMNYYEAGHMMYLDPKSLAQLKTNVSSFIQSAASPSTSKVDSKDLGNRIH